MLSTFGVGQLEKGKGGPASVLLFPTTISKNNAARGNLKASAPYPTHRNTALKEGMGERRLTKEVHDAKVAHRHDPAAQRDQHRDPPPQQPRGHNRLLRPPQLHDKKHPKTAHGSRQTPADAPVGPGKVLVVPQGEADEGREEGEEEGEAAEEVDAEQDLEGGTNFAGDEVADVVLGEGEGDEEDRELDWNSMGDLVSGG